MSETEQEPQEEQAPKLDPQAKQAQADADLNRLVHSGLIAGVALVVGAAALALAGVPGMWPVCAGLALGSAEAVLNMRILGAASWRLMEGEAVGSLLGFGASFLLLVASAFWLVRTHTEWLLGWGLGLALPAVAGLVYARLMPKDEEPQ